MRTYVFYALHIIQISPLLICPPRPSPSARRDQSLSEILVIVAQQMRHP